nr:immunoglobulin heavy chain junction region [Mus musculus]
CARGLRDYW